MVKVGKHHRIPSRLASILISVIGFIIVFILPVLIFFLFILEAATLLWLVNYPAWSMFSVTFTAMVSISLLFLIEFSIFRRIICTIGNLSAPAAALSKNNLFCLGSCLCSLEFLYLGLQLKHWVFYL